MIKTQSTVISLFVCCVTCVILAIYCYPIMHCNVHNREGDRCFKSVCIPTTEGGRIDHLNMVKI